MFNKFEVLESWKLSWDLSFLFLGVSDGHIFFDFSNYCPIILADGVSFFRGWGAKDGAGSITTLPWRWNPSARKWGSTPTPPSFSRPLPLKCGQNNHLACNMPALSAQAADGPTWSLLFPPPLLSTRVRWFGPSEQKTHKIKTGYTYSYVKLNFRVGLFSCIFWFEAIFCCFFGILYLPNFTRGKWPK